MVMNLYILFSVSLPLAILDLIQFLLFAGKKDRLKINKPNVIRFVISIVLMLLATNFIRPVAPNVAVNLALHIAVYVIILILVYRITIQYAVLSVAFTMLIYSTIENAYVPYIVAYISKGWDNFGKQYMLYPIYTLPNFICCIIVIRFLWKYEILMISKINKNFYKLFIYTTLILILVEYILFFLFYTYFDKMPLAHQIAFSVTLLLMSIGLNLLVLRLIHKAVVGLVQKGYDQYSDLEEAVKYAFVEIQKMLKEKNYDGANNFLDEIMNKEEEKITKIPKNRR
ncbi:MAG: hypothetical protein K0R50_4073 [Eubacterium sp.]|jgi:hypothetical protein|nr:hypothetical protein [Eubacterium sp.]